MMKPCQKLETGNLIETVDIIEICGQRSEWLFVADKQTDLNIKGKINDTVYSLMKMIGVKVLIAIS